MQPMFIIYVALGGALGAAARFMLAGFFERLGPAHFPIGIMSVNIIGCFLMGVLVEALAHYVPGNQALRLFIATGVLGGFTTFSAFSLETIALVERGQLGFALLYVAGSVTLSLVALFAGMWGIKLLV